MNTLNITSLAQQQQALLQALWAHRGTGDATAAEHRLLALLETHSLQTARGLSAYRSNGHTLAERSLLAAYPVVAALMGGDNFALLARDFWHRHPPRRGDLAQWGDALPGFVQAHPDLADTPYLGDVARAEWALHRAAGAADATTDLASFARLGQEDPQGLALVLAAGTTLISSPFPVASLVNAHLQDTPSLDEAARRLQEGQGEHALVWRQGFRPRLQAITPAAAALIRALQTGGDLTGALDAACAEMASNENFDFSSWLTAAVTDGLVIGVGPVPTTPTTETTA